MTELVTQPAEVRFTIEVTRGSTGEKECIEMVGYIVQQDESEVKEQ